jgi:tubulin monoglycylase TTLL3/8
VKGADDKDELSKVQQAFDQKEGKNIWIVKPGEDSNRGNGIKICSTMEEIIEII